METMEVSPKINNDIAEVEKMKDNPADGIAYRNYYFNRLLSAIIPLIKILIRMYNKPERKGSLEQIWESEGKRRKGGSRRSLLDGVNKEMKVNDMEKPCGTIGWNGEAKRKNL